jgi:hypothetical protein
MSSLLAFAAHVLLSLAPQDKENPEFGWWSAHKAGSWVKLRMEAEQGGVKILIEATHTLLEITKDKAVVEQKTKVTAAGQAQPEETQKEEIPRDASKARDPIKIDKEGDEEIEVAGKKMKCHWIEGNQKDSKPKFWLNKEIPGSVARAEVTAGGATMKIAAVSWEKK